MTAPRPPVGAHKCKCGAPAQLCYYGPLPSFWCWVCWRAQ